MTLEAYLEKKQTQAQPVYRGFCCQCRLAQATCDCARLQPFSPATEFVILMHPEESRRRIATGRLTHLILRNSHLIIAESFEYDARVTSLLADDNRDCVVLYPGSKAVDVERLVPTQSRTDSTKIRTIFVLDGTWRTAKKMLRLSPSLASLPQICFTPPHLSTFRIRKQPKPYCYSTLEAVHHILSKFEPALKERDRLIDLFDAMVERQILYAAKARLTRQHVEAAPKALHSAAPVAAIATIVSVTRTNTKSLVPSCYQLL